jgi:hypothetical protein
MPGGASMPGAMVNPAGSGIPGGIVGGSAVQLLTVGAPTSTEAVMC